MSLEVCGPSGLLDFVLRALRALRPCDDDSIVHMYVRCMFVRCMSKMGTYGRTDGKLKSRSRMGWTSDVVMLCVTYFT